MLNNVFIIDTHKSIKQFIKRDKGIDPDSDARGGYWSDQGMQIKQQKQARKKQEKEWRRRSFLP